MRSWDRDLSICHVKWSVRVQEKCKKVSMFFGFWGLNINALFLTNVFWCFSVRGGSESCEFVIQNRFLLKFWSKTFFSWFVSFRFFICFCFSNLSKFWFSQFPQFFTKVGKKYPKFEKKYQVVGKKLPNLGN